MWLILYRNLHGDSKAVPKENPCICSRTLYPKLNFVISSETLSSPYQEIKTIPPLFLISDQRSHVVTLVPNQRNVKYQNPQMPGAA